MVHDAETIGRCIYIEMSSRRDGMGRKVEGGWSGMIVDDRMDDDETRRDMRHGVWLMIDDDWRSGTDHLGWLGTLESSMDGLID